MEYGYYRVYQWNTGPVFYQSESRAHLAVGRPSMLICVIPGSLSLVPGSLVRSRTRTPRCCATSSTPAEKFVERGLDTLEDALLHFRRLSREGINVEDSLATWDDPNDPRPRLLVLGSGWAAHALVKIIEADQYRLLVVSPRNYFVFTPMLAASSVGTVEYRSITEPMRAANPTAGFIEGVCVDIDTSKRIARVETALREDRRDATGDEFLVRLDNEVDRGSPPLVPAGTRVPTVED